MNTLALLDGEERAVLADQPHLSHSQVSRYLHCPEQYRLYYVEKLRLRVPSANLVFGSIVHQALAGFFSQGQDPVELFGDHWGEAQRMDLAYGPRESWERLLGVGQALLTQFLSESVPRITDLEGAECPFTLDISSLDLPFVGIIDLIARLDGKRTVIDFKTSATSYPEHEVVLSDQLTAYQVARPDAEQSALCVLVKTKEPSIEWHVARRGAQDVVQYLAKVGMVAQDIMAGRFYKRPGRWCAWCDYLPVCLGNERKTKQFLVRIG